MNTLNTVLAALLGASSVLASAGAVYAQEADADLSGVLEGPVSDNTLSRLASGGRTSVIVILDVPMDEVIAAAEDDPEGDYLRDRIAQTRSAVMGEAFSGFRSAERSFEEPASGYTAFDVTPGFVVNANAEEIARLRAHPAVQAVYDNLPMRPATDVSMGQIGADVLWSRGVRGAGTSVAILDTGIEAEHPMVEDAIIASACFNTIGTGDNNGAVTSLCPNGLETQTELSSAAAATACPDTDFFPNDPNAADGCAHGTHVASIAAGRALNLSGGSRVSGAAPSASIVAVNVFSRFDEAACADDGEPPEEHACVLSYSSDQIRALDWLYQNRTQLNLASVNMSLGGFGNNVDVCTRTSINNSMGILRNAGVAVVVASGNDANSDNYTDGIGAPACVANAISVGAVDDNDEVTSFSNDAPILDLLAPGSRILAGIITERPEPGQNCQVVPDTEPNSDGVCHWFSQLSGTSMATPHVAGAFALLRSSFPSASVDEMLAAFKITGVPVMNPRTQRIHARIQVDAAYDFLASGQGVVRNVSLADQSRYDARNTNSSVSSFNTTSRLIQNTSGQSRTIRVVSKPSWLTTEFFSGSGAPSGSPVSVTSLTMGSAGQLRLGVGEVGLNNGFNSGELVLSVDGSSTQIRVKVTALVTTPIVAGFETVRFGPFEWVGDVDQSVGSIFRLVGLNTAIPASISADIERWGARDGQTVTDASIRCDFTIRANRYSGNEYLIGAADFADCPRFDRGDVYLDVRVDEADATSVRVRRFLFNGSGGITDAAFDPSGGAAVSEPLSARSGALGGEDHTLPVLMAEDVASPRETSAPQATAQTQFGPFEWTYDANGALRSEFRLSPILTGDSFSVDVAIANASASGYAGNFNDCSLTIRSVRRGENDYQILPEDLADCGAFGRADLTFRVTADSSRINYSQGDIHNMRMQRFIRQTTGSLTDFHLDSAPSSGAIPANLSNGSEQVIVGPFEWTGDSTAPTSNQFRIAGVVNGAVSSIDVMIANATASGYAGGFNDCSLTIRPQRAGANDFLILREDLADCGAFGRGDLTFRIRVPNNGFASEVKVRRLAFGALGDITDFGFDAEDGAGKTPTAISGGREEVVFGPFEWVGDAQAGTQGVFRITGIDGGLPDSIEVAIANATGGNGQYIGDFSDCSITLRPAKAGRNEYVIGASDFSDCGSFGRGDLSFRIRANAAVLDSTVRMRRFAVTTAGGLTDFGFDNE
ncbi:S8 family serine peptidase [Oceanicaulis sp. LC35]|uniref:S8 family serine peptidase n=1 Tax=Oceanicaulis sp. LC35 TaxID=3349635 RepID=UPI003F87688F